MVKANFTDGEIWRTLESSPRCADRAERKGEKHARQLYETEISKARQEVTPFAENSTPVVPLKAVQQPGDNGRKPAQAKAAPAYQIATSEQSFITRYVQYAAQRTDAPKEAHELYAVTALSALAGPRPRLPISSAIDGMSLVVWAMNLVNSTAGRKTTTIEMIQDIIEAVLGVEALIQWEGSPQGMIQRLQARDGQAAVFSRDEYSGLMAQLNRGGHMAGLSETFIRAWDGRVIENIRTRKRGKDGQLREDTDRVEHPYLVKLTASNRDAFMQRATVDNVLNGFLARSTFISADSEPRPLTRTTAAIMTERDSLVEHAQRFYRKASAIDWVDLDDDVLGLAWQLETEWRELAENSTRPEAMGPSLKRLADTVFKTAALMAIDEADAEPCVFVCAAG